MTGLPASAAPDPSFGAALAAVWSAIGEDAVVRAVADAALTVPGVGAVRVHTVQHDRTVVGPVTAGVWAESRSRWRRQEQADERGHDLFDRRGATVGTLTVQLPGPPRDDWPLTLLVQQAGLAVAAGRDSERLDRVAAQARTTTQTLRVQERTWRSAFGEAPIGMSVTSVAEADPAAHLQVNETLTRLTGYSTERLLQMTAVELIHPDDRAAIASAYRRVVGGRRIPFSHTVRYIHADGHDVAVQVTTTPVFDDDGTPLHAVVHVLDLEAHSDPDAERNALLDPATGLLGHPALTDELTQTLHRAERHATSTAVVFLDLHRLRAPGADLDTTAADLGTALGGVLRPEDTLARVDESTIAVVLEELSADNAVMVADRFGNRIRALPHVPEGTDPGVGIAMIRPGECSADAALGRAGDALRDVLDNNRADPVVYATPEPPPRDDTKVVLWARDD